RPSRCGERLRRPSGRRHDEGLTWNVLVDRVDDLDARIPRRLLVTDALRARREEEVLSVRRPTDATQPFGLRDDAGLFPVGERMDPQLARTSATAPTSATATSRCTLIVTARSGGAGRSTVGARTTRRTHEP